MNERKQKTVLIVEDDIIMAQVGKRALEKYNYIVFTANTGETAIKLFSENNAAIDLILMDVDLGRGMDGTETAEIILKDHDVPVVFLSSHVETEIVEKTEKITSYGYVVKGTGITVLDASIKMAFKLFDAKKKAAEKERALLESEQKYRNIFDNALEGIYRTSFQGKFLQANRALSSLLGYDSPEELVDTVVDSARQVWADSDERSVYVEFLEKHDFIRDFECRFRRRDGGFIWVSLNSKTVRNNNGEVLYFEGFIEDITERRKNEEVIRQNESRLRRVVDILQHRSDSVQEFLDYSLDQVIQLTESKIGYIYHYHEERRQFELNTWSKEVMAECRVAEPATCYELDKTGIWGEAVRQRKPIVINDFQSQNPLKKGYPEGHVRLMNFMTVPVFMNGKIVCVVGLANKKHGYNETDILQTTLLMEAVWKVTEKIKIDEKLRERETSGAG